MSKASAVISECGNYRYRLTRPVSETGNGRVVWVMLNPSTADASVDDPTIRKCVGFARRWGFAELAVVNLFAWRATNPRELTRVPLPQGRENDLHIAEALSDASLVVFAWGRLARKLEYRARLVADFPGGGMAMCLGYTKGLASRQPRHPLMLAYATPLESFAP